MTRRSFILIMLGLATSSQLANLFLLNSLSDKSSKDGIVMRDGWMLSVTDL